jgi:hypothetical protein
MHVCALNDRHEIWCWGDNYYGSELDGEAMILAPRFLDTLVSSVVPGSALIDGGLYDCLDEPGPSDGGTQWSQRRLRGVFPNAQMTEAGLLAGDTVWTWAYDAGSVFLAPTGSNIDHCGQVGIRFCNSDWSAQAGCRTRDGGITFPGHDACPRGCQLQTDAGVTCFGQHVPLPPSTAVSGAGERGGCAIDALGVVRCWSESDPPQTIPGLGIGARQIEGSLSSGCAVVGSNLVQCWGDNEFGLLGRPGGPSTTAVTHVFDEPVVAITAANEREITGPLGQICAQLASGRAACWGLNPPGYETPGLGVNMLHSDLPIQIVR